MSNEETNGDFDVWVRRQWNDCCRRGKVKSSDIWDLHWSDMSGGINVLAPRAFLHGYIWCTAITEGEVAHSCRHGQEPHRIKICIVKVDNPGVFDKLQAIEETEALKRRTPE